MLFQTRSKHPKTNLKYHALHNVLEVMGEFSHFQQTANPLKVKSSNLWPTCPPEPLRMLEKTCRCAKGNFKRKLVEANWEWSSCLCKISSLGLNNYTDSATQTQSTDKTQTKSNISSARYTFSYRHVSQWSKNRGVQHDPTLHPLYSPYMNTWYTLIYIYIQYINIIYHNF